jgi:hypothetical protein
VGEGEAQPDQRVLWSIAGDSKGAAIDATGLLTLPENAEPGATVTVRATSAADPDKHGSAEVTIIALPPDIPVRRVLVSPQKVSVQQGQTQQFAAQVEGTGAETPSQSVTWSIVGEHHGETAIDGNGLLRVSAEEEANSVFIRAVVPTDSSKYGSATVTIVEASRVASISVEPENSAVVQGYTRKFIAHVVVTGDAPKTVTWSLSGASNPGTVIDQAGILTVALGEPIGTRITVTATSAFDAEKTGSATLDVAENILLPSLEDTIWRWGDRPAGSITIKEFVVESIDEKGVQHGHLNCYRPFDPDQQVYVDWYYYDPVTKTGAIEYLTEFFILPDNSQLVLPQYASYGHGAVFFRIFDDE